MPKNRLVVWSSRWDAPRPRSCVVEKKLQICPARPSYACGLLLRISFDSTVTLLWVCGALNSAALPLCIYSSIAMLLPLCVMLSCLFEVKPLRRTRIIHIVCPQRLWRCDCSFCLSGICSNIRTVVKYIWTNVSSFRLITYIVEFKILIHI